MSDFINTVDIIDDDILMDGLIERTISGSFNDDKVTSIKSDAFCDCINLESVCFPNATSIGAGAFNRSGLKAITPETFPKVTGLPYTYSAPFFEGSALETIDWPSLTRLDEDDIFINCTSLKSISLPNLSSSGSYGGVSLKGCTSLTDVNLPLFPGCPKCENCTSLESITLPLATKANSYSFNNCTSLQFVDLPSCTEVGSQYTFSKCPLKALILRSTTMCVNKGGTGGYNPFGGTGVEKGTGYIYVPRDLVDSYKAYSQWKPYALQFRPLEDYTVDGTITGEMREHCESIALDITELTFTDANSQTLTVTGELSIYDKITWAISDKTIVRVNKKGVVTPVSDGTATITVMCGKHTATCTVTVNAGLTYAGTNILDGVGFNAGNLNASAAAVNNNSAVYTDKFDISSYAGKSIELQLVDVTSTESINRICFYNTNNQSVGSIKSASTASYGAVITQTVPNNAAYAAVSIDLSGGFSSIDVFSDGILVGYIDYMPE